jgi:hypothetical protein
VSQLKGVTLWNPYAFAMVACARDTGEPLKTVETRSWPTSYRGPIAIHAAQEKSSVRAAHLIGQDLRSAYVSAMGRNRDHETFRHAGVASWEDLPFGMILGVGNLVACVPTSDMTVDTARRMIAVLGEEQWESDRQWGNFAPGRWLWHIQELNVFPTPIPYRGAQGLYDVHGVTA